MRCAPHLAAVLAGTAAWLLTGVFPLMGALGASRPARLPLKAAVLGIGVEVHRGYVRVSEVLHLENTGTRPLDAELAIPFPSAARFMTFHEGLSRPRVEADKIVDRLIIPPGPYRIVYAYTVAGAGEITLSRNVAMPIERVDVLTTPPASVSSEHLVAAPPVTLGGQTFLRASGRLATAGPLRLAITGVPPARSWPAPAAAALLAGLLAVGLGRATGWAGVANASWKRFQRSR